MFHPTKSTACSGDVLRSTEQWVVVVEVVTTRLSSDGRMKRLPDGRVQLMVPAAAVRRLELCNFDTDCRLGSTYSCCRPRWRRPCTLRTRHHTTRWRPSTKLHVSITRRHPCTTVENDLLAQQKLRPIAVNNYSNNCATTTKHYLNDAM